MELKRLVKKWFDKWEEYVQERAGFEQRADGGYVE